MTDTVERLTRIVVENLGVPEEKVTPVTSLIDDLGADSLDLVEMVMTVEEEFGVEIPDTEAEHFLTIRDAADWLDSRAAVSK